VRVLGDFITGSIAQIWGDALSRSFCLGFCSLLLDWSCWVLYWEGPCLSQAMSLDVNEYECIVCFVL